MSPYVLKKYNRPTTKNQNKTAMTTIDSLSTNMYAQLHDDTNPKVSDVGSSTASSSLNVTGPINGKIKIGSRVKNKNLELQKSLIEDGINGDSKNGDLDSRVTVNKNNDKKDIENGSSSVMVSDDDPFYVFKEDLQIKLEMLDDGLERFERIVQITVSLSMLAFSSQSCSFTHFLLTIISIQNYETEGHGS